MDDIAASYHKAFRDILKDLLEGETPLNPRFLFRLSDLAEEEIAQLRAVWSDILEWRRQALLEDLETLFASDSLLSFEAICRIALNDSSPQVRFLAMRALQGYEVIDLIPFFIQTMLDEEDEEIRALAAANLGKYIYLGEVDNLPRKMHKEIEEFLLSVAHGSDTDIVRRKAVEALAYSSHQDIPGLIQAAYQSEQPEWVASALYAMGRTIDLRWEPQIKAMLHNSNHEIRFEAIRAAGELELTSARPTLIEYLDESDREIRMAAVWALARIGGENIQALLIELLQQAEREEDIQIIEDAIDHLAFYQGLDSLDDVDLV